MSRRLIALFLLTIGPAKAGMTSIVLSDLAEARIEVISFFILIYLLLTLVVKFLWNKLAQGIPAIPKINFRRALCLMLVSGLFMYVILTMISGARELMTPGAWEKEGISYRLKSKGNPRKEQIQTLRDALWKHAEDHDGRFPSGRLDPAIPYKKRKVPDGAGFYSFLAPEAEGEIMSSSHRRPERRAMSYWKAETLSCGRARRWNEKLRRNDEKTYFSTWGHHPTHDFGSHLFCIDHHIIFVG
ncbi:hypothetical protein N9C66_09220 [Akkermansiaceae bacterium]|nr:hypothetical protein [Akkermansiaceae bacterium]MDA9831511.1 hypothetical protein [Akkermansiaceae bacterium]MDB4422728.1 hypothetical protein [bacterium]MDB4465664.1 hypothetical protein [Akkermansiaceae bacterium]